MRKVLVEKNKKEITKEDAVEMIKKAINTSEKYSRLYTSELNTHFSIMVSEKFFFNVNLSITNYAREVPKINCFVGLAIHPTVSFDINIEEFNEIKRMIESKKEELYVQCIKKKEADIDVLKNFLTM